MKKAKQFLIDDYGINKNSLNGYSWIEVAMEEYADLSIKEYVRENMIYDRHRFADIIYKLPDGEIEAIMEELHVRLMSEIKVNAKLVRKL